MRLLLLGMTLSIYSCIENPTNKHTTEPILDSLAVVDTSQNWDSINAVVDRDTNSLTNHQTIVSAERESELEVLKWEGKKNADFYTYYKVQLKNNTSKSFKSFQFSLECVFEENENKKFNVYVKKILRPLTFISLEVNSSDLNNYLKNSKEKIRFIYLELNEAIDENDNPTTSVKQSLFTNLLKISK